jgi:hypothetical protein
VNLPRFPDATKRWSTINSILNQQKEDEKLDSIPVTVERFSLTFRRFSSNGPTDKDSFFSPEFYRSMFNQQTTRQEKRFWRAINERKGGDGNYLLNADPFHSLDHPRAEFY